MGPAHRAKVYTCIRLTPSSHESNLYAREEAEQNDRNQIHVQSMFRTLGNCRYHRSSPALDLPNHFQNTRMHETRTNLRTPMATYRHLRQS